MGLLGALSWGDERWRACKVWLLCCNGHEVPASCDPKPRLRPYHDVTRRIHGGVYSKSLKSCLTIGHWKISFWGFSNTSKKNAVYLLNFIPNIKIIRIHAKWIQHTLLTTKQLLSLADQMVYCMHIIYAYIIYNINTLVHQTIILLCALCFTLWKHWNQPILTFWNAQRVLVLKFNPCTNRKL